MMGLSLGPATGKLVSELVNETQTSMNISKFNPERFA
jgi:D-amino-acid dehydrogenase